MKASLILAGIATVNATMGSWSNGSSYCDFKQDDIDSVVSEDTSFAEDQC